MSLHEARTASLRDLGASTGKAKLLSGYVSRSQIAREMTVCQSPYSWDDVTRRREVSDAQKRIRNEAGEMGLANGLFTPIIWHDRSHVAVVLAGPGNQLADPLVRTWAEIISSYYACEGRRLMVAEAPDRPRLSSRQRECLTWVRHGKSSGMISDILGLSVQTVDEHIREACKKLGVRTRIQAAVEATLSGVIE